MPAARTPTAASQPRLASQEYLLVEALRRLQRHRAGRSAVHLRLSRLQPYRRQDHHVRVAGAIFENLVRQIEGSLFPLANGDLVFVFRSAKLVPIEAAAERVKALFEDDPAVRGPEGDEFCLWYDLEWQYDAFAAIANRLLEEHEARLKRPPVGAPALKPIDPARLAELLDAIARADLSNLLRRQTVCVLMPDAAPQPIFQEIFVSVADLRDAVLPGYDVASDRWLFQHMTQALDRRMLRLLVKSDDSSTGGAISINVNVATILSPDFMLFDRNLRSNARGTIVLELQAIDIFADLSAYCFARDFARERGYRICLDGVDDQTLLFFDRERLGLDLVKVIWRPAAGERQAAQIDAVRAAVDHLGRARMILCRCDDEMAVAWGQSLGIAMFQGRYVDRLVSRGAR